MVLLQNRANKENTTYASYGNHGMIYKDLVEISLIQLVFGDTRCCSDANPKPIILIVD